MLPAESSLSFVLDSLYGPPLNYDKERFCAALQVNVSWKKEVRCFKVASKTPLQLTEHFPVCMSIPQNIYSISVVLPTSLQFINYL